MPNINLEQAEQVLAGAKAAAMEMGKPFSFSVVDARGDLITMCRMDGTPWRTPYVSRGKARAAACFGEASGDLTERSTTPIMRAVMEVEGGEFVPGQGALPIYMNGELIGAVRRQRRHGSRGRGLLQGPASAVCPAPAPADRNRLALVSQPV